MTQQLSQERFLSNTYSFTCNMQYCQACEMYICVPLPGLEIKKILRSPFGDQLEKYSRQMQIFSRRFL